MKTSLTLVRFGLPIIIIAALGLTAKQIMNNPPEAERSNVDTTASISVNVMTLQEQDYQIHINSYGTLQPRTKSMLVAQVAGQITSINPSLREGGFFEKGDELLSIDNRDYVADVKIAEASLMDARQLLAEENARSEQALKDWNRLGNTGEPSDLVLRKPQLMAAEAKVISASSSLTKSRLALERTKIIAPYAGRVMEKMVDIGQVVSANSELAEIYASDTVEIRLPVRNRDLAYLELPESYRFSENKPEAGPGVQLITEYGEHQDWHAQVVRTESRIDETARQLHVVAQIDDPFGQDNIHKPALKIGQYVTADIQGKIVKNALVIPNLSIYQGSYVYIVENDVLHRRDIEIAWQNDDVALIRKGLVAGDQLVLTSLGQVTSGVQVKISNNENEIDSNEANIVRNSDDY